MAKSSAKSGTEHHTGIPAEAISASDKMPSHIRMPLLSPKQLNWQFVDRSTLSPELTSQLQEWEEVMLIHKPRISMPKELPSAIEEIKRLTHSSNLHRLGEDGPSIASISFENTNDEALKKFEVVHGRDALQTALHLHRFHPQLLVSTVLALAEKQGVDDELYVAGRPFRQEEKGKIMLLSREPDDPTAVHFSEQLEWGWPFYGSVDGTPLFIVALCTVLFEHSQEYEDFLNFGYTDRNEEVKTVKESLDAAVSWLITQTDKNEEQLLEYHNPQPAGKGILNQAWKDSAGAYVHADGEWANHDRGIASVEVQGLAYDAYIYAAKVYEYIGDIDKSRKLQARAAGLRLIVLDKFWTEDERGGYFILGTDRDKDGNLRPMKVRASNMGQLLNTQLLKGDEPAVKKKVWQTVKTLCSDEMLAPNGLRTLSKLAVAFRERGYHVGNVWLWDNDAAGHGAANHGYYGVARMFWNKSLRNIYGYKMFPEFVPGGEVSGAPLNDREIYVYDRKHDWPYLFQQIPQFIQGWSVSSALATKYSMFLLPESAVEPELLEHERELAIST